MQERSIVARLTSRGCVENLNLKRLGVSRRSSDRTLYQQYKLYNPNSTQVSQLFNQGNNVLDSPHFKVKVGLVQILQIDGYSFAPLRTNDLRLATTGVLTSCPVYFHISCLLAFRQAPARPLSLCLEILSSPRNSSPFNAPSASLLTNPSTLLRLCINPKLEYLCTGCLRVPLGYIREPRRGRH